jgi:hypothetical protein
LETQVSHLGGEIGKEKNIQLVFRETDDLREIQKNEFLLDRNGTVKTNINPKKVRDLLAIQVSMFMLKEKNEDDSAKIGKLLVVQILMDL